MQTVYGENFISPGFGNKFMKKTFFVQVLMKVRNSGFGKTMHRSTYTLRDVHLLKELE